MPSSSPAGDPSALYCSAEFLLRRRSLPPPVTFSLLRSLPSSSPPPPPPSLRRLILLHHLSSPLPLSPLTLTSLELLLSLYPNPNPNPNPKNKPTPTPTNNPNPNYNPDPKPNPNLSNNTSPNPNPNSNPNSLATDVYLSLAVHLACNSSDFPRAVEILFTQRIGDFIKSKEVGGLIMERAREVKEEMERAVGDLGVRERVLGFRVLGREEEVERKIRVLVEREWEEVERSKSVVELAVEKRLVEQTRNHPIQTIDQTGYKTGEDQHPIKSNRISTPDLHIISNKLKSSMAELQINAQDPLPDAIEKAGQAQMEVKDRGKTVISSKGEGKSKGGGSIMDRNPTACTYEWNDSIESDSDNLNGKIKRQRLPSPKTRAAISPLKLMENNRKIAQRRKAKRWTILEEDTLRKGVKLHGKGNWKAILNCYPNIFEERTDVDLKDKWRNMTKD